MEMSVKSRLRERLNRPDTAPDEWFQMLPSGRPVLYSCYVSRGFAEENGKAQMAVRTFKYFQIEVESRKMLQPQGQRILKEDREKVTWDLGTV